MSRDKVSQIDLPHRIDSPAGWPASGGFIGSREEQSSEWISETDDPYFHTSLVKKISISLGRSSPRFDIPMISKP